MGAITKMHSNMFAFKTSDDVIDDLPLDEIAISCRLQLIIRLTAFALIIENATLQSELRFAKLRCVLNLGLLV